MRPHEVGPRQGIDDYMSLPEGTRAELISGEILMAPSPRFPHQRLVIGLASELRAFVNARALGDVCVAPLDVHLPSGDIVQPDVIVVRAGRRAIIQDWIRGVPDLLIEVVSPEGAERDRIVKRELYARNGVEEYWIADPQARTIEVLALDGGAYVRHGCFEAADRIVSSVLAELDLPVARVVG